MPSLTALIVVLLLAQTSPQQIDSAQTTTPTIPAVQSVTNRQCVSLYGQAGTCDGELLTIYPGSPSSGSTSGTAPVVYQNASGKKYLPYDRVIYQPDGSFCVTTAYHEEGTAPIDDISTAPGNHGGTAFNNFYEIPPCDPPPRAPGQPAPLETPAMIAARYLEQIPLPKPKPAIAPGRAITGKLAYLETKGETVHVYTNNTIVGRLAIHAAGSYNVDWGDGTTSGPYSFEGKPWPDGQITHEYVNTGTYNVVVTENWSFEWDLGGDNGTLRSLQTTGTINNFPVQQIQAVIGR